MGALVVILFLSLSLNMILLFALVSYHNMYVDCRGHMQRAERSLRQMAEEARRREK